MELIVGLPPLIQFDTAATLMLNTSRTGRTSLLTARWCPRSRLAAHGVSVNERMLPDKHQLQMSDWDGIQVNLNFPLAEAAPTATRTS